MKRIYVKIAVLAVAAAFIGIGVHLSDTDAVVAKAVKICLECIGIG